MISFFLTPTILFFSSFHGLVVWGWSLWTDRLFSLSPGLAQPTPTIIIITSLSRNKAYLVSLSVCPRWKNIIYLFIFPILVLVETQHISDTSLSGNTVYFRYYS